MRGREARGGRRRGPTGGAGGEALQRRRDGWGGGVGESAGREGTGEVSRGEMGVAWSCREPAGGAGRRGCSGAGAGGEATSGRRAREGRRLGS